MIPAHIEALALADAIGALDVDEQRELRSLVAALPPDARQEVARLYDSALALAASVPQVDPPPRVRDEGSGGSKGSMGSEGFCSRGSR